MDEYDNYKKYDKLLSLIKLAGNNLTLAEAQKKASHLWDSLKKKDPTEYNLAVTNLEEKIAAKKKKTAAIWANFTKIRSPEKSKSTNDDDIMVGDEPLSSPPANEISIEANVDSVMDASNASGSGTSPRDADMSNLKSTKSTYETPAQQKLKEKVDA